MEKKIKINKKLKNQLWWMIISIDYDYSRVSIADNELNTDTLNLWLEDKHDFKNSLEECLKVAIPIRQFAKIIKEENLNSYEGTRTHPQHNFVMKCRVEINEPIKWYQEDASITEQQWAREAVVKKLLYQLAENETVNDINN